MVSVLYSKELVTIIRRNRHILTGSNLENTPQATGAASVDVHVSPPPSYSSVHGILFQIRISGMLIRSARHAKVGIKERKGRIIADVAFSTRLGSLHPPPFLNSISVNVPVKTTKNRGS
jgi:hypothetical protein